MIKGHFVFFLLLFLFGPLSLQAQVKGQTTEEEMRRQQVFIEANKERLLGNYDKAIGLFSEVLKMDPENAAAAYELARTYDAANQIDKALEQATQAVSLAPETVWYQLFLGDLYQKAVKYKEAATLYEKLILQYPDEAEYYYKQAYFLVLAKEYPQAVKVYETLEKRVGINEETSRRKHTLYLGIGDYKKAEKELRDLSNAFPQNTDFLHLLAGFYQQMGDSKAEMETYRQILALDPDDSRASLALVGQDSPNEDESNYLRSLQPIFAKPEVDLDQKIKQLIPFVQKLADTGQTSFTDALLELSTTLETAHPNQAKVYALQGDLLYHAGRKTEALEKYRRTLELDDTVYLVWEQLLYTYHELQQYDALAEASENAMDLFPNQATLYYLNGLALNRTGQFRKAVSSLNQALIMAASDKRLQFNLLHQLGIAYQGVGDGKRSNASFDEALRINSNDPQLLSDFSLALSARQEALDKALEMSTRATELSPGNPSCEGARAYALYRLKKYTEAQTWYQKALEHGGNTNPTILEGYGDVQYQLGKIDEAVALWEKAAQNGANHPLLKKKIEDRTLYE